MDIYSIFWCFGHFIFEVGLNFSVEHESIDSDVRSSCVCLHSCCHESLREEESRCPVRIHIAVLDPLAEEDHSFDKVIDP